MNTDILLRNPERMSAWAKNPSTVQFLAWLAAERESVMKRLRDARELIEIGRFQGELERIDKIHSAVVNMLRDEQTRNNQG